jgi:hypothetical protein
MTAAGILPEKRGFLYPRCRQATGFPLFLFSDDLGSPVNRDPEYDTNSPSPVSFTGEILM